MESTFDTPTATVTRPLEFDDTGALAAFLGLLALAANVALGLAGAAFVYALFVL